MALVPVIRVWTSGEVVLASYMTDNINGPLSFLLNPPQFKGYATVAQSIPNSAFTSVSLDSEVVDNAGGHSTVTNTSRYTAVYAGWYNSGGGIAFAANATGRRFLRYTVNGTAVPASLSGIAGNAAVIGFAARPDKFFLNVGDIGDIQCFQDSGGALNTFITNSEYQPGLSLTWCGN